MKLLKTTILTFLVTVIFSICDVNAKSIHFFAGLTLPGHSKVYNSSTQYKSKTSYQYFKNVSANDKITQAKRAIKVQIENVDLSGRSSYKEINVGSRATYKDSSTKYDGNYKVKIKTANILSNDIYFNGNWYLDDNNLNIG